MALQEVDLALLHPFPHRIDYYELVSHPIRAGVSWDTDGELNSAQEVKQ